MSRPSTVPGILGDPALDHFDALIIGSGAGGSAAAHVLTAAGRKVLVLEAGDNPFPGLDGFDGRGLLPWPVFSNDEIKNAIRRYVYQDPLVEPRTFRQGEDEDAQANEDVNVLTRNVGGAAVISGVGYPRFTAIDFRLASALRAANRYPDGTSFIDWPFGYAELAPFYTAAEQASGVAGALTGVDADPFSSRTEPFPMLPQPSMYVARVLANGASQRGYAPFNLPSAINTQPYQDRPPCVSCGFCSGYGCPRNAKGSPAVTTLRRALLTGKCQLRYNAHVTRLQLDGARQHVTGVEYVDDDGQAQTATAPVVILAASAIESVRLCLLSGLGGADGIGSGSGHLGRHMLFHFQTIGVGIFKQRLHGDRGRSVTHAISDFRGVAPGGADLHPDRRPLGGVVEFGTSSEPIVAARESLRPEAVAFANLVGASFKQLVVESPFSAHIAVITMQGEDAPQPSNRVDLDPTVRDVFGQPVPRLTYRNHAFELDASMHYKPEMLRILKEAGAGYGFFSPFDPTVPPRSRHVLGGLRMGLDPHESVCDGFGKFHDVDNLYCVDGGVFPTGSGYNPTLTIIAVALRGAAAIAFPEAPQRALTLV